MLPHCNDTIPNYSLEPWIAPSIHVSWFDLSFPLLLRWRRSKQVRWQRRIRGKQMNIWCLISDLSALKIEFGLWIWLSFFKGDHNFVLYSFQINLWTQKTSKKNVVCFLDYRTSWSMFLLRSYSRLLFIYA